MNIGSLSLDNNSSVINSSNGGFTGTGGLSGIMGSFIPSISPEMMKEMQVAQTLSDAQGTSLSEKLDSIELSKSSLLQLYPNSSNTDLGQMDIQSEMDDLMLSDAAKSFMTTINGTEGNDTIKATPNQDGSLTITVNGQQTTYSKEQVANGFIINAGDGNDKIDVSASDANFIINSGEGNNTVSLGSGRNISISGNGNNTITNQNAAKRNNITTGSGTNDISLGTSTNKVTTNGGSNTITAGKDSINQINDNNATQQTSTIKLDTDKSNCVTTTGSTDITVGNGNNIISSFNGKSNITAGNGNNAIEAGNEGNKITVGNGNNYIVGGLGDDTIVAGNGNNIINGLNGNNTITTGDGNNHITASINGKSNIKAGDGNNTIIGGEQENNIKVGNGNNYIEGGAGDDKIVAGNGDNVIYGLDGDDTIVAGNGDNYIDGGKGNDTIIAGNGKNIVMGGRGDDKITVTGTGGTIIDDSDGSNINAKGNNIKLYDSKATASLGQSVAPYGDPKFNQRVQSDLEVLRATESGRKLLGELDKSGHKTTIEGTNQNNGGAATDIPSDDYKKYVKPNGQRGDGADAVVGYNPSYRIGDAKPSIILFHELAHAYNITTGTMSSGYIDENGIQVKAGEHQAVGLSMDGFAPIAHPDGTNSASNPEGISENAFRTELGLDLRETYII